MQAYHTLAECYDRLTNDVDYSSIVDFYFRILEKENVAPKTAADLACGTGSVARLLAQRGIVVTGVDLSEDMLTQAQQKTADMVPAPVYVCQDLCSLRFPRGVDLAVSALDGLDYITDPERCAAAIRRVYHILNPGGIFIFDVNTPEKLRSMDDQIFLDEDENVYCVWRGSFDMQSNICTYGMDIFRRKGQMWLRSTEEHCEYAYSAEQLTLYLKAAGFASVEVFADRQLCAPREGEQRIFLKARKGWVK